MKQLTILLSALIMFSCSNVDIKQEKSLETSLKTEKNTVNTVKSDFSNPAIIYGSDFLTFFKSLRKLGKYDEMVKFTSSKTLGQYGESHLKSYYENKFTNMSNSKLTNIEKIGESTYTMFYTNKANATKRAFQFDVVIENDSTKLILNKQYPF
tara:strand:- start:50 stop:508 length:459 start_codon:yes stop_codon:yes gene_type:complete